MAIPAGRVELAVCRSASPVTIAAATATLSERRPGRIGHLDARIRCRVNGFGHAGAFAAEQQDVVGLERVIAV